MSASLVNVFEKEWVVELLWRTETGRNAKANVKKVAKEFNDDLMVIRTLPRANYGSSAIQVGLASSASFEKKLKSPPSLAATLASIRSGSWLGAFALAPNLYYGLIVKDGAILSSGGDKLFSSEDELLQHINSQRRMADWDFVVSSGVALDNAETVNLEEILIGGYDKTPKLRKIGGGFSIDGLPLGRVVQISIIVAFGAYYLWPDQKQQQPILATKAELPPAPPPWPAMQAPSAWIDACAKNISATPSAIGGWSFASLSCDGASVLTQMNRTPLGTLKDMLILNAALGQDGKTATLSKSIEKIQRQGSEPGSDIGIKNLLIDAVEIQGDAIDIRVVPPPLPGAQSKQAPPTWTEIQFQIRSTNDIGSFGWLDTIPGLRITKISYTPTETSPFKIEGVIYAKK